MVSVEHIVLYMYNALLDDMLEHEVELYLNGIGYCCACTDSLGQASRQRARKGSVAIDSFDSPHAGLRMHHSNVARLRQKTSILTA